MFLLIIIFYALIFINNQANSIQKQKEVDLTIVGSIDFSKSLARFPIGIINLLKNDLKINFITAIEKNLSEVPNDLIKIIEQKDKTNGKVALLTDVIWLNRPNFNIIYKKIPKNSKLKISYSMIESSRIPNVWTKILNSQFDSVVVPEDFLIEIYKNSGVKIPIFVLPIGLYLEEFLQDEEKKYHNTPFIFGCSAFSWERKNLPLLINTFIKTFGNNSATLLKIHTNNSTEIENCKKMLNDKKIMNVQIITKTLPWNEYINLFRSFDCYILISKGEGFSITPREALALGIPCIISNNTAHKEICDTGLVLGIDCPIKEPAYNCLFNDYCGYQFNCKIESISKALQDVYKNYGYYLEKAKKGRAWVQQFLYKNLKKKYLNLIKPTKVILGNENKITDDYLMTNSEKLYKKYIEIIK